MLISENIVAVRKPALRSALKSEKAFDFLKKNVSFYLKKSK